MFLKTNEKGLIVFCTAHKCVDMSAHKYFEKGWHQTYWVSDWMNHLSITSTNLINSRRTPAELISKSNSQQSQSGEE